MINNSSLIKLIKDCKKHKRNAQKLLYKEFYSYSMSICMRYAQSREDAVEIMNDGFMKVFTYILKFDTNRPFKPWLRKIMINSAIDYFKKNNEMIKIEFIETGSNNISDESQLDSVSYEEILEIIRKLPPVYGAVFNMRAIEGYKHEEIAKMLNISVGTSKSNYSKAKAKLREYLSIYFGVQQQ